MTSDASTPTTAKKLGRPDIEGDLLVTLAVGMVPTTDHQDAHKQPTRTELR